MALDLATVLQRDTYHKQQKENRGELGLGQKLKRGRNKRVRRCPTEWEQVVAHRVWETVRGQRARSVLRPRRPAETASRLKRRARV